MRSNFRGVCPLLVWLLGLASVPFLSAQSAVSFPNTAVGSSATAQSVTFTFSASTTVTSVSVLYKGAANLDFTQSGTSNCVGTHAANSTCTVAVVFSPKAVGWRRGAVELIGSGGILQTAPLSGIGQGAAVNFTPSGTSSIGTFQGYPDFLAFDAQGNLLVADYPSGAGTTGQVVKIPYSNGSYNTAGQTVLDSGLNYVDGLAYDGAGNLYVSDFNESKIQEFPAGAPSNGSGNLTLVQNSSGTSTIFNPNGLIVDGAGNLIFCDWGNNRIREIPFQNGTLNTAATITIGSGLSAPADLTLDPSGNLLITDWGNARIVKVPYQSGTYNTAAQSVIVSNLPGNPSSIYLDPAGNMYLSLEVTDTTKPTSSGEIMVIPYQGGSYNAANAYAVATGLNVPDAVAEDAAGNIIFCDTYNGFTYLVNTVTPPSLAFGAVGVGVTSTPQSVRIQSSGNLPLSLNSVTYGSLFPNQGTTCTGTLAVGTTCQVTASFAPTALGSVNQSLTLSDDATNVSSPQTIAVSGTGVQGPQSINFPNPGPVTYGTAPIALSASGGGSGNPVIFSLVSGPGTLSGANNSTLTVTGAGSIVVAANQAGSSLYTAAPAVQDSITVNPAVLTVTAGNLSMTYGGAVPSLSTDYSFSGFVNSDTATTAVTGAPALSTTATSTSTVGSYAITLTTGTLAAANYSVSPVNGTLTINKALAPLSWTPASTRVVYGNALGSGVLDPVSPGVYGVWAYTYGANHTSVTAASVLPAGSYTITASFTPYTNSTNIDYASNSISQTITITPAVLTVTAGNASMSYGAAVPSLTAYTITGYVNGDTSAVVTGTPTLSTTATSSSTVGTYPIAVAVSGMSASNYTFTGVNSTLTVTPAIPAATWNPTTPDTFTYGTTFAGFMNATTSVAGTWAYKLNGAHITAASYTGVGTNQVEADFTPTDTTNYKPEELTRQITIQPAPLQVIADSLSMNALAPLPALTYHFAGFVLTDNAALVSGAPTLSVSPTASTAAGTYPITIATSGMSAANYYMVPVNGTLTVNRLTTSVSWSPNSGTITYGTSLAGILNASSSTGGALTYTVNGNAVTSSTVLGAGSDTITATLPQDSTHAASSATFALTVNPAPLTVTVNSYSRRYGAANPSFSGTVQGAVNGDNLTATYGSLATVTAGVGTYPITATLGPSNLIGNYSVTNIPGTLTVTAAPLSVVANNASRLYGAANPSFSGTITGIQNNDPITATYGSGANAASPVGSYAITGSLNSSSLLANYSITNTPGTLTVSPAPLTITVNDAIRIVNNPNPSLTGTVTGIVNNDALIVTYGTTATPSSPIGDYPITASIGPPSLALNYSLTVIPGTLHVIAAFQVITFPAIANQIFAGVPITVPLNASASSGLPVSYSVTGPASVSGSTLTITSAGTVSVTASQAGGNGYPAATPVTVTFTANAGLAYGLYADAATCSSISIIGSGTVDSYDSSQGAFPAGQQSSGGNLGTNGNLQITGSAVANGDLYDPHGNTTGGCGGGSIPSLSTTGNGSLTGNIVTLSQALTFLTPAAPSPAPPTTNQTLGYGCNDVFGCSGDGGHLALAPGQYGNLSVGGGIELDLSAGTYNLNSLAVGGGAWLNVTSGPVIVNLAGAGITGHVLNFSGAQPSVASAPENLEFLYAGSLSVDLGGGSQLSAVLYAPNAPITIEGAAVLEGAAVGSTLTLQGGAAIHYDRSLANNYVDAAGSAPVSVAPGSVDFGSVPVNTTSSAQSITITNTGSSTLNVSSIAATPGFGVSGNCSSVAAGSSCSFGVTFTPASPGSSTGVLTVTDNSGSGSQTVALSGIGTAAGASLSPNSLTFSTTQVGATSFAQTVTLSNTGNIALSSISIPASVGDFAVSSGDDENACGASLAAGASCSFSVTMTPSSAGAISAALSITDSVGVQVLTLNGTGAVPGVSLSASTLGFGSQTVGLTSSAQTVTLTNSSALPVAIHSITTTPMFEENDNCSDSLDSGDTCNINVTFSPFASGTQTGTLTITDNAPTSPQSVTLTGTGVQGLQISPSSFNFGSQEVGVTSPQQTFSVKNTGSIALTLSQFQTSGDFAISQNLCRTSLATGSSCSIFVTYTPSSSGAGQGSLTLADSTGDVTATTVLSGTGTRPGIDAEPANLNLGGTAVGQTSSAQTVTVTNTGTAPLNLQSLALQGDFTLVGTTCLGANNAAQALAVNANCVISVAMTPTTFGARTGSLTIYNDATGQTSVALSGTGQGANVTLSTSQLAFGSQPIPSANTGGITLTSPAQTVTLTNSGNAALIISSVNIDNGFGESNTCGASVASGASCSISVTFAPTAEGQWTGNLVLNDDAPGGSQTVAMTGSGSTSGLVMDPSQINFGGNKKGKSLTRHTKLENNTGSAINGLSIAATGSFTESDNCGTTLASGATCTVTIVGTPETSGRVTGYVVIAGVLGGSSSAARLALRAMLAGAHYRPAANTQNSSANLAAVALEVFGNSSQIETSPSNLSFAAEAVASTSAPQTVTITNGDAQAALTGLGLASTPDFPVSSTDCGAMLAAGASCTAQISFDPSAAGSRTGTLTISADGGLQASVGLSGSGNGGTLTVGPGSLSFAPIPQGKTSSAQSVTLTNSGNSAISVQSYASSNADFTVSSGTCGAAPVALAAGSSCTLTVSFAPSQGHSEAGSLSIASNTSGASAAVGLSGAVMQPLLIAPATLSFGNQGMGIASPAQTVTVSNQGTVAVAITTIAAGGDFSQTNNCGTAVQPGTSCQINIALTPTSTGSRSGTLAITNAAAAQSVALTGAGTDFALSGTPAPVTIDSGGTASFSFAVTPGSFSGPITATCSGAPSNSLCSVSPATTNLVAGAPATMLQVSVSTNARGFTPPLPAPPNPRLPWLWLLALAALLSSAWKLTMRPQRRVRYGLLGALLGMALAAAACGGAVSNLPTANNGTPAGTYHIVVSVAAGANVHTAGADVTVN